MYNTTKFKQVNFTDIERINLIIETIVRNDGAGYSISDLLLSNGDTDKTAYSRIADIIIDFNLANMIDSYRVQANNNSRAIVQMGGYQNFLNELEKEKKTKLKRETLEFQKLKHDAKLSKWQYYGFWPAFILGTFGGFYSIYSSIDSAVGESIEQKVQRILKKEILLQQQPNNTSTHGINKDTLSIQKRKK
jgi:hypothetical protein